MAQKIPFEIIHVDPRELTLLKKNARYMEKTEYDRLVDNIKRDGCLTSSPLVHFEEDWTMLVLSGNHRTMASIDAGLKEIPIILTWGLSADHKKALQLSHNAIAGKDNQEILKQLYLEIESLEEKAFSGLNDRMFQEMQAQIASISAMKIDYREAVFLFLPEELERIDAVLEQLMAGRTDAVRLASLADHQRFFTRIAEIKRTDNIKNNATAFMLMLDIVGEYLAAREEKPAETDIV